MALKIDTELMGPVVLVFGFFSVRLTVLVSVLAVLNQHLRVGLHQMHQLVV